MKSQKEIQYLDQIKSLIIIYANRNSDADREGTMKLIDAHIDALISATSLRVTEEIFEEWRNHDSK